MSALAAFDAVIAASPLVMILPGIRPDEAVAVAIALHDAMRAVLPARTVKLGRFKPFSNKL